MNERAAIREQTIAEQTKVRKKRVDPAGIKQALDSANLNEETVSEGKAEEEIKSLKQELQIARDLLTAKEEELTQEKRRSANLKVERDNAIDELKEKSTELTAALRSVSHLNQQIENGSKTMDMMIQVDNKTKNDAAAIRRVNMALLDQLGRLSGMYNDLLVESIRLVRGEENE